MKTKSKTKAGLTKGKKAGRLSHGLTAFELETITVSLELASAHFEKAAKASPMSSVRNMHLGFAVSANKLLDLIRDGQFSLDLGGAP